MIVSYLLEDVTVAALTNTPGEAVNFRLCY